MGGRGSMGGTRSTYRGNSTSLFQQNQNNNNGGDHNKGGGGGGTDKGTQSTKDQSTTTNKGGGGGGGGSDVTTTTATTDTNDQTLQPDPKLEADFIRSNEYKKFLERYGDADEDKYDAAYAKAFAKFIGVEPPVVKPAAPEPDAPAGLPFRRKPNNLRVTEEQIQADVETINRNWGKLTGEWDINCQRCTNAVEYRARGYDVRAQPITEGIMKKTFDSNGDLVGTGASVDQIARQWVDADGNVGTWDHLTRDKVSREKALKMMEDEILSWGEGARGFVYVAWMKKNGGGAHIFNVEVRDGKPYYIDGQTNQIGAAAADWKDKFSPSSWRGVMRVDNLEPRAGSTMTAASTWVKERTSDEINVPSKTETISRMNNLWPLSSGQSAKRNAFFAAWSAIYKGNDQSPPPFVNTPELLDAFNQGLAFARRPD